MEQMGHTDPRLALRIYAHSMRRGDEERAHLRALVNGVEWASTGTSRAADTRTERSPAAV